MIDVSSKPRNRSICGSMIVMFFVMVAGMLFFQVRGLLERGEVGALPLVGRPPEREALK